MKRPNQWWQQQFAGDLRVLMLEIGVALLVAIAAVEWTHAVRWTALAFPVVFVVTIAILLRLTSKKDRS